MNQPPSPPSTAPDATDIGMDIGQALAAYSRWWRLAGLEWDYQDEPHAWLTPPEPEGESAAETRPAIVRPKLPPPPTVPAFVFGGPRGQWPASLAEWDDWWLGEPALDPAGTGLRRVAPSGPADAPIMVIVEMPEEEDGPGLLQGPQGRLLDAILSAMGLDRARARLATLLPRTMPAPDWAAMATEGLGDVLAHHVALSAPEKLLFFGRTGISTLERHASSRDSSENGTSQAWLAGRRTLVLPDLAAVLQRPQLKAAIWRNLLGWN